jgi:outer membrane protein TolC
VDEYRLRLVRDVRMSWWNLFYLDRALDIVRRNQTLLRQFITIAQTKYKVGRGLQQDVLLAQVELSKLLDIELQLKGARKRSAARLNALLGRSAAMPVALPERVSESLPPPPDERHLHDLALQRRPLLKKQDEIIEAARTRVALAEKDYYPDFRMGAAYGFRQGNNTGRATKRADFASFGLSLNLPIFTGDKQDRALDEARAETARARFGKQDIADAVRAEVSRALADYRRAREQSRLFKQGIIPQSSQTVASMLAGYQVGKVDFLNLVRAQITLYNYETQYWKSLAEARQAMARLEAATAGHLEPIKKQENPNE